MEIFFLTNIRLSKIQLALLHSQLMLFIWLFMNFRLFFCESWFDCTKFIWNYLLCIWEANATKWSDISSLHDPWVSSGMKFPTFCQNTHSLIRWWIIRWILLEITLQSDITILCGLVEMWWRCPCIRKLNFINWNLLVILSHNILRWIIFQSFIPCHRYATIGSNSLISFLNEYFMGLV